MTQLVILSSIEHRKFDSPPVLTSDNRALYFSLTSKEKKFIQKLRTATNKAGFLLQLGYFKANAKFYTADQFRRPDIEYVSKILGIPFNKINFSTYQKKIPTDHRKRILKILGWKDFNKSQQSKVKAHIQWLVQRQSLPKHILLSVIDFCWQNKIELPSYNTLANIITYAYNFFESNLLAVLRKRLTSYHKEKLNNLVGNKNKRAMDRPTITLIKQVNQSLSPSDIQENVESFKILKEYFYELKPIIEELKLSDQATEYFATWVQKASAFQIAQFPNRTKLYLHLLCYIKHQFYYRHDMLADIFLKSVRSIINAANNKHNQDEKEKRPERNKAIKNLAVSNKNARELIEKITEIVKSHVITKTGKLTQIEVLINQYTEPKKEEIIQFEESLDYIGNNQNYFDALKSMSIKLQRRVSAIAKLLEFNPNTSDINILEAINSFKTQDGEIRNTSPLSFLKPEEKEMVYKDERIDVSLYKILLFSHMADSIKSGHLNLIYSYRYRAIQDYLIDDQVWRNNKNLLLENAGLKKFANFDTCIKELKKKLDSKYETVNERFLNGENNHLSIDEKGILKVTTPKIESSDNEYISSLLNQNSFIPILQVLSDVNRITGYTEAFEHFSIKHTKIKPHANTIFAGLIGKGCNIGVNRIANISIGITEDSLKNTVNWCFSLKNIQKANNKIIAAINKLFLANAYRHTQRELHTSSDGRKISVSVDSLLASHSFKYFGKGKGVTIYTFIDERQLLFYSTVISSSEREAAYVIDGLLQNDVIKSDIHSTDTHGYTETVFAATHFIDTAFAPRIKNIRNQKIYSFSTRQLYEKRGYKILPSRIINLKLMEINWDDILRFMTTIKLKHTSASQLFRRLSSYAKDHPLYKALKEFGRIIKSIFILTYLDEVELRQRIEKQLNRIELSNKFSKAVFFANSQELKCGTKEEQEIAIACKVLIQNTIVLWNYLYLSQLLANNESLEERNLMIELIKKSSVITWQHVNLHGEYDFTKYAANDNPFDMQKISALKAA